jgi:hypothetical protein
MKLTIRGKILVPTLLLFVAGIATVATMAYNLASDALHTSYYEAIEDSVISLSRQIDDWLDNSTADVLVASDRNVFRSVFTTGFAPDAVDAANAELIHFN